MSKRRAFRYVTSHQHPLLSHIGCSGRLAASGFVSGHHPALREEPVCGEVKRLLRAYLPKRVLEHIDHEADGEVISDGSDS